MNYYCEEVCDRNQRTCDEATRPTPGTAGTDVGAAWAGECQRLQTMCYAGCVSNNREALYATTPDLSNDRRMRALRYVF